jgi:hypothetical protein
VRSSSGLGRFAIGLGLGLGLGAGGTYLALERPWRQGATAGAAAPPDAAPAVAEPTPPGRPSRRPRGARRGAPGEVAEAAPRALSAADRVTRWRGDAVALPPATIDLGGDGAARSLSRAEIQATIDADGAELQRCVIDAVGHAPYAGEVIVEMLVGGDGQATRTRVHAAAFLHDRGLVACARGAVRRLRFPAVGGATVVTIPFPIGE